MATLTVLKFDTADGAENELEVIEEMTVLHLCLSLQKMIF